MYCTYLIRKNAIDTIIMKFNEPIESFQLVGMHLAVRCKIGGLTIQTNDPTFGLSTLQELCILFSFRKSSLFTT